VVDSEEAGRQFTASVAAEINDVADKVADSQLTSWEN